MPYYAILIDVTDYNLTVPLTASVFWMRICKAALNEQTTSIATYSTREFNLNRNYIFRSSDALILAKLHNFLRWNIWFRDIHSYKLHLQYSKVSAMIPPHPRYHNTLPWDEHLGCRTVTNVFHLGLKFIFQRNLCRLDWRIPNLFRKMELFRQDFWRPSLKTLKTPDGFILKTKNLWAFCRQGTALRSSL